MFISYAQNFEDVMLNRVFANKREGIYIDVGAQHPLYDSVTKAFYDRGWHGINIEPVKEYYELLVKERERDINLNLAAGETESKLDFFELEGTGLSTFERETAERISQEEGYKINCYQVPVVKLADIIQQNINCPIDFLKIDVEGWEEQVVLGNDWARFRPTVVVLEATFPNSPTRAKTNIADILKGQNYQQVYFDGLNDYYLANESSELLEHFATPPNVFDEFVSYHLSTTQAHAKNLEQIIQARDENISNIQQQLEQNIRHNHIINNRLENETFEAQRLKNILMRSQNKAQENIDFLNQELKTNQQTNHLLTQEIAQLKTKLETTNRELNTNQQNNNLLTQEITQLKTKLETTNRELNTNQQNNNLLTHEITQLKTKLTNTNQQLNNTNQLVAAMETSKFWKMRTIWFRIKSGLGIKQQ